jgi:hypothetical protein
MVEILLSGIVLFLIPITVLGLFINSYLQFLRDDGDKSLPSDSISPTLTEDEPLSRFQKRRGNLRS